MAVNEHAGHRQDIRRIQGILSARGRLQVARLVQHRETDAVRLERLVTRQRLAMEAVRIGPVAVAGHHNKRRDRLELVEDPWAGFGSISHIARMRDKVAGDRRQNASVLLRIDSDMKNNLIRRIIALKDVERCLRQPAMRIAYDPNGFHHGSSVGRLARFPELLKVPAENSGHRSIVSL